LKGHSDLDPVEGVSFSANGKLLLSHDYTTARIWDAATGRSLRTLGLTDEQRLWSTWSAAFSPNGKLVVTANQGLLLGHGDGARIWDATSGRLLRTLRHADVGEAAFSPNGKLIVTATHPAGGQPRIRIWRTASGRRLHTWEVDDYSSASFSPDSSLLATGRDPVSVWRTTNGRLFRTVEGEDAVFSPDGKLIATDDFDDSRRPRIRVTRIWEIASGRLLHTFKGGGVTFSPNGRLVLTRSWRKVRIWRTFGGTLLRTLRSGDAGDAVFSADGELVATKWYDNRVHISRTTSGRTVSVLQCGRRP
jgi:WD40 repeat protein